MNPGPRGAIPPHLPPAQCGFDATGESGVQQRSQPAAGVSSSCSCINPLRRLHLVVILPRKNRTGSVQRTSAGDRAPKTKYAPGHSAQQVKGNHGCSRSTRARILTSKTELPHRPGPTRWAARKAARRLPPLRSTARGTLLTQAGRVQGVKRTGQQSQRRHRHTNSKHRRCSYAGDRWPSPRRSGSLPRRGCRPGQRWPRGPRPPG